MAKQPSRQSHWEQVYTSKAEKEVSWFEEVPTASLDLIRLCRASAEASIIDIGGGASHLVDALLDGGFRNITVLDLSTAALETARRRLGDRGAQVTWVAADATDWEPREAAYDVWHDRAAFHFLTEASQWAAYLRRMAQGLKPGGHAVIGTFALDGPEKCSGLPVCRYSPASLAEALGPGYELIASRPHIHITPWMATQSFQFSAFRRL